MQVENHSKLAVDYLSGSPEGQFDRVCCQVVGKVLGEWNRRGCWRLCWELDPPFFQEPQLTPWGSIAPDFHLPKSGCDVVAQGRAYSPHPRGSSHSEIVLRSGKQERKLVVFGPRYWIRGARGLFASSPERFTIVDLEWEGSFGGRCQDAQGNAHSFAFNPRGRGFQRCEIRAQGQALPHFEDPNCLIARYDDQPRPCNLKMLDPMVPLNLYPDPLPLCEALAQGRQVKLPREFHNIAHPSFRFAQIGAGSCLSLQGMLEDQQLELCLPKTRYMLDLQLGSRRHELELKASTIQFFPETRQCSISYSAHFYFRWIPKELRLIQIWERELA